MSVVSLALAVVFIIKWQQIFKWLLPVTPGLSYWRFYGQTPESWQIWNRFATHILTWDKYAGVSILVSYSLKICSTAAVLFLCAPCIFARICLLICRVTIFKLIDGSKIRDITWMCASFESRSMLFNISNEIRLQNIEIDFLETFAKCWKSIHILINTRRKIKEL